MSIQNFSFLSFSLCKASNHINSPFINVNGREHPRNKQCLHEEIFSFILITHLIYEWKVHLGGHVGPPPPYVCPRINPTSCKLSASYFSPCNHDSRTCGYTLIYTHIQTLFFKIRICCFLIILPLIMAVVSDGVRNVYMKYVLLYYMPICLKVMCGFSFFF